MNGEGDWTFWLNVTNAALGLVVLGAVAIVGFVMFRAYLQAKEPQAQTAGVGAQLAAMLRDDSHHMIVPELGLTMADGGEKKPETPNKQS